MKRSCRLVFLLLLTLVPALSRADSDPTSLEKMAWQVGSDSREAQVYIPPADQLKKPVPIVFIFHGHGGRSQYMVRKLPIHTVWPGAICVYPQGLPTAVPVIDPQGHWPGWQKFIGDQNDRDLKFFDAMLAQMKKDYPIDDKRVYVTGHSNGGFFSYTLWAARGDEIAAVAAISATANPLDFPKMKPKPVLAIAGKEDPLVRFEAQQKTMDLLRQLNKCDPDGKPAGQYCTLYTSADGPPVMTFIHPGGHMIPDGATDAVAKFFEQH